MESPSKTGKKPAHLYIPNELKTLRGLGLLVLLSLFIVDSVVWVSFRWVEENEIHQQLITTAQHIEQGDIHLRAATSVEDVTRSAVVDLPNGVVAIQRTPSQVHDDQGDFRESDLLGQRYVVYSGSSNYLIAKSDESVDEELTKLAVVLAVVFFAQCLMLGSWWAYLRSRVRALFDV